MNASHFRTKPAEHIIARASGAARSGFTLVELLLSMTILAILMVIVTSVISMTQKTWARSNAKASQFREARMAFDILARNVSQATLNTYMGNEFDDSLGVDAGGVTRKKPTSYVRKSELQFVSGKTADLLGNAPASEYPGHGVFFQATLGVGSLTKSTDDTIANTENMVNLLCGRGYFVQWGSDQAFRPPFLGSTVKVRNRYRLMEFSPTAEANQIYYDPNPATVTGSLSKLSFLVRRPITERSRAWFLDAKLASQQAQATDSKAGRGFVRPVADNILCLVVSPQRETGTGAGDPSSIAPNYEYDSVLKTNPGASAPASNSPQGTQHLLPPLLKITLVALDAASGEKLAEAASEGLRQSLADKMSGLFSDARNYSSASSKYRMDLQTIEEFLTVNRLNYRVFSTTLIMKQAKWGM